MNRYKKLINNSLIFAIGNFGSKIINLIMVPLYTFTLTTEEYGLVDLLTTSANLLFVIITLGIGEATIRFIMQKNISQNNFSEIVTITFLINSISSILLICIYPMLNFWNLIPGFLEHFIVLLIVQQFQVSFGQIARGYGKVKEYAVNGILMTIIIASLNIYLLSYLDLGVTGYLLSIIIANIASIVYFSTTLRLQRFINFKSINKSLLNNMLKYSIPLIPNGIMWWLINGLTRFFILIFVGVSGNGLFAVASKIPSILSLFTSVFQQAWQLSAFEEYDSENRQEFYGRTFKIYYQFLFVVGLGILIILKGAIYFIVQNDYKQSWILIPALLLGAIYQSFSSFFGTANLAAMDTRKMFSSTLIGSVVSAVSNLIFLPTIGIFGAGLGTFLGFFVMWFLRAYNKGEQFIVISRKNFIGNNLIFLGASLIVFTFDPLVAAIINTGLMFVLLVINNELVTQFVSTLKRKQK